MAYNAQVGYVTTTSSDTGGLNQIYTTVGDALPLTFGPLDQSSTTIQSWPPVLDVPSPEDLATMREYIELKKAEQTEKDAKVEARRRRKTAVDAKKAVAELLEIEKGLRAA